MKLRDTPIQRKLMSVILLTCGIVLSMMCIVYIIVEFVTYRQSVKTNISTLGAIIASNSSAALVFDSPEDAKEVLDALKAEENIRIAALFDNDGELFAQFPSDTTVEFPKFRDTRYYWFENRYIQGYEPVLQKKVNKKECFLSSLISV